MTIAEFVTKHGITATATRQESNPNVYPCDWKLGARHWLIILRHDNLFIDVPFTQGSAHTTAPTAADVLECLASDADVMDHESFETWASDFGLDTDSRAAERTYRACLDQTLNLRRFLGEDAFAELRQAVEQD